MSSSATPSGDKRPLIALAMGDPAGISPELAARLISSEKVNAAARLVVIGDRRILENGPRSAGLPLEIDTVESTAVGPADRPILVDLHNLDPVDAPPGETTREGGCFAIENFSFALRLAAAGDVAAVCYMPFNKKAMRLAHPGYDDESRFIAELLRLGGRVTEFNVLDTVWNARVTSHIPLKDVAASLSREGIQAEIKLTLECLSQSGIAAPRLLVAGLNPHAGDGGSFGMEEIDIIGPAVGAAAAEGFDVAGPFPADTVFLTALKGGYHAVLTMYHDQGQIAMKLMGFDRGVTMLGGLPFPVCTPAHGTAYDIAGEGIANPRASEEALLLAARMAPRLKQHGADDMGDIVVEDPRMVELVHPGARVERLWTGAVWSEGPVWWEDGSVTWSDIPKNRMMRWHPGTGGSVFRQPSGHSNGHTRDREGRLVSCEHSGRRISRTEANGTVVTLVDRYRGKRLNSPNDVVVKADGTIWFTDPSYGILSDDEGVKAESEIGACHVYRYDPSTGELEIVADDFEKPNGLAFSPDESLLYVSDTGFSHLANGPRHIRVFDVVDGRRLANSRIFADVRPGASDGFRVDVHGNVFTSSHDSIQVYAPDGTRLGKILVPEIIANCTFGGSDRRRLFITASTSLYAIDVLIQGAVRPSL